MKFFRDAVAVGIAGAFIGLHFCMFMSPRTQKEVERGLKRTVREMKELSQQMLKVAKQIS